MTDTDETANRPTRDKRLESLHNLSRRMSEAGGDIMHGAITKTRPGMMSNTDPYEKRRKAAANRNGTLRKLGMPEEVSGDEMGRFVNTHEKVGFLQSIRNSFSAERVIWEMRDEQGRLHSSDGPAAVTSRGTMLFMQEGAMKAGPDGFAAITPDGRAYRGEEQARGQFGHLVGLQVERAAREGAQKAVAGRRHEDTEAEL